MRIPIDSAALDVIEQSLGMKVPATYISDQMYLDQVLKEGKIPESHHKSTKSKRYQTISPSKNAGNAQHDVRHKKAPPLDQVDYLNRHTPSLLHFMENQIQIRDVLGLSRVKPSANAPKHASHLKPKTLVQEPELHRIMKEKDSAFDHVNINKNLLDLAVSPRQNQEDVDRT